MAIKDAAIGSCFFCLAPDAELVFGGPIKWPRPIDPDASFLICDKCAASLTAESKAKTIWLHAMNLRKLEAMSN